jgi:hypothetical protein
MSVDKVSPLLHPFYAADVVPVALWVFEEKLGLVLLDFDVVIVVKFLKLLICHPVHVYDIPFFNLLWLLEQKQCSLDLLDLFPGVLLILSNC